MGTPSSEEIQEFLKEETEYTTIDEAMSEAYIQAVEEGNRGNN